MQQQSSVEILDKRTRSTLPISRLYIDVVVNAISQTNLQISVTQKLS